MLRIIVLCMCARVDVFIGYVSYHSHDVCVCDREILDVTKTYSLCILSLGH